MNVPMADLLTQPPATPPAGVLLPLTGDVRREPPAHVWGGADPVLARVPATVRARLARPVRWPLLLHGEPGTGKTALAVLVYQHWATGRGPVRAANASDLLRALACSTVEPQPLHGIAGRPLWYRADQVQAIAETALFVVDDVGCGLSTDAGVDALLAVVKVREGRPLILTSNRNPAQLSTQYDARIADRLAAGTALNFDGLPSQRKH